jgi:hypothetical protein
MKAGKGIREDLVVEIWAGKKQESVTMAYNMPNKYVR